MTRKLVEKSNLKNAHKSTLVRRMYPEINARELAVARLKREAELYECAADDLEEYNSLPRAEKTAYAEQLPGYEEYLKKAKERQHDARKDPELLENFVLDSRYSSMKQRAKEDGRAFSITPTYLRNLLAESGMKCNISGRDLTLDANDPDVVSFDRVNNNKGYVYGNIQVVSSAINVAKLTWTQEEFIEIARQICKHNGVKL